MFLMCIQHWCSQRKPTATPGKLSTRNGSRKYEVICSLTFLHSHFLM